MPESGLILGAYAASATLPPGPELARFWQEVFELRQVRGLELPIHAALPQELDVLIASLPRDWDYVLSLLPGTMQSLQKQPLFGLASGDAEGRRAALALAEQARLWTAALHEHCRRPAVIGVHLHSAPQRERGQENSASEFLHSSLTELLARDWSGARLCLEHCDAWRPDHKPIKGFLDLSDEIEIAQQVGIGITLNWGRSALELRSSQGVLQHIRQCQHAGLLWGFMFSGTAVSDPLYGDWQDTHAPIVLEIPAVWQASGGLLTLTEVSQTLAHLRVQPLEVLGLKVQPFPSSLDRHQRLAFLRAQLAALSQA